ncbi:MAG: NAD(P)-dependent oxidoreductase [Anaerolineae bacterium]|nr:NAD(P)-dependent oxidoreductase [Anaerolineae bacterium]
MKLLVIGGSGIVGSLVVPFLAEQHQLRLFDLRPPQQEGLGEYIQGDVTDHAALTSVLEGVDALLYMAMGNLKWEEPIGVSSAFDVNVKGVHMALWAAHTAGITQAVYTSSMSVYAEPLMQRYFADEDLTPDAAHLYGLTKRMGEEVCHNASRLWGMNINVLRLCFPTAEEKWLRETVIGKPTIATTAQDVARAMLAALEFRAGYQAFTISGDYENKVMNMSKAKRLLGWEPLARPTRQADSNEQ